MLRKVKESVEARDLGSGEEGFTLIELLIVIVVLGILAAVVVFALSSVNRNAHSSACNADAKTVETAVSAYNAQHSPSITTENTGVDTITVASTAGIVAGQTVVDNTVGGPSTPVVAVIDANNFTVADSVANAWSSGDLGHVGVTAKIFTIVTPTTSTFAVGSPDTYSTGAEAQLLLTTGLLKSWPQTSNGYAISLSTTKAGDIAVYVPATNTTAVDFESQGANAGCNNPNI